MAKFRGLTTGSAAASFGNAANLQVRGAQTIADINQRRIGRLQSAVGQTVGAINQGRERRAARAERAEARAQSQAQFERQQSGIESQRQIVALSNIAREERMMLADVSKRRETTGAKLQELRGLQAEGVDVGQELAVTERLHNSLGQRADTHRGRWQQATRGVMDRFRQRQVQQSQRSRQPGKT